MGGAIVNNIIYEANKEGKELPLKNDKRESFRKILKCGIYKELHKRSLLSDEQLNSLINEK